MNKEDKIKEILEKGDKIEVSQLFAIYDGITPDIFYKKYILWRKVFSKSFKRQDPKWKKNQVMNMINLYLGGIKTLADIKFRGAGKTTEIKWFVAFFLCNDIRDNRRKYIKISSKEISNAVQLVTDLWNILMLNKVYSVYGWRLFQKSNTKREETMSSFTLATNVKVKAFSLLQEHRGNQQGDEESSRPDFHWVDDPETSNTIQSSVITNNIWTRWQEAYNGLSRDGVELISCNHISKTKNIQKIIKRSILSPYIHIVDKVPLVYDLVIKNGKMISGTPSWDFTKEEIEQIYKDADDFWGEYNCDPKGSTDSYFNEDMLALHPTITPILEVGEYQGGRLHGWTYLYKRQKGDKYIISMDTAGGKGGNYAVILILNQTKGRVEAFYCDRWTKPDKLTHLAIDKAIIYNDAMIIPEMNFNGEVIAYILKERRYYNYFIGEKYSNDLDKQVEAIGVYMTTNVKTMMFSMLNKAINNFTLLIPSLTIKEELILFPREYVEMVKAEDEEIGHFDLTMALAIAWYGTLQQSTGKVISKKLN